MDVIKNCPACGNRLIISELTCKKCGIKINGEFTSNSITDLNSDDLEFIKKFLQYEGNITKMQIYYSETYNLIKNRLSRINEKLGVKTVVNNSKVENLAVNGEDSNVIRKLKEKIIESGGKAFMPVLKGDPVPFWLSSTERGFESAGLKGVVLEWEIFDAIVNKANSLGGKMYRGDSAAQNGAKIGSEELSDSTIDGFISLEFYGAKIGNTALRRSTYYAGILAWAGIVTNHRSQGKGGYITVNKEYLN